MDAQVVWQGKMSFTGRAGSGFELPLGAASEVGGDEDGFRPLELFAVGLAGCTAMDVISILRKKRQDVTTFKVAVHADRAESHPKIFTQVRVEFTIEGREIDPQAVERAIQLSTTKYCPAQAMLEKTVSIVHTYAIKDVE